MLAPEDREWCCFVVGLGRPLDQGSETDSDINPGKAESSNCFPRSRTSTGRDKQKVWLSRLTV